MLPCSQCTLAIAVLAHSPPYVHIFFLSRLFCNFAEKMEKEDLLVVENAYVTMNCQENINTLLTNWTGHWNYSKSSRLTYKTIVLVDTRFIGTRFIEIHSDRHIGSPFRTDEPVTMIHKVKTLQQWGIYADVISQRFLCFPCQFWRLR